VLFLSTCGSGNNSSPEATGGGGAIGPGSGGTGGAVSPDISGSGGVIPADTGGSGGTGGMGGSVGPDTGGTSGAAGVAGSRGCDQDMSGTWDLIASRSGDPSPGLLVISRDTFTLTFRNNASAPASVLTYSGPAKAVDWSSMTYGVHHPITVQNTPGPMSLGVFPVSAGGSWLFTSREGGQCAGTVSPGAIDVTCTTPSSSTVGGADWPNSIPGPRSGQSYGLRRSQARASWFGDAGGDWQSTPSNDGSCTAKFQDNTVLLNCATSGRLNGDVQLTVSADCVASGSTSGGYELSARRR
jgi:hypothetical protein